LLNKYEVDVDDRCSVVKADLVDSFQVYTNRVLSPRWFTSIYKLFPYVTSTRKLVNDRFVYLFHQTIMFSFLMFFFCVEKLHYD